MTLAADLVQALGEAVSRPLPPHVARLARLHLMDAVGVGLAANTQDVGAPYRKFAAGIAGQGAATVFGRTGGTDAATAAMINGGLIHSLEYDDTHTASIVHGSAVLAPTALAAGEMCGSDGSSVLNAYVLGWELLVRLGEAAPGRFQAAGFQITSVGGALAAAFIAARLSGLDDDATVTAMGIALSQASGVFEFLSNGSSVKSLHPGWAAHSGILASQLARHGLTGPVTSLEGRYGLFSAFARDQAAAEQLVQSLTTIGRDWKIAEAAFKFYPCCHYIHPFIEAAQKAKSAITNASEIKSILCRVPPGATPVICEPWGDKQRPVTPHAARWSLPIAVAAEIIDGRVELDTFSTPIRDEVFDLASRTSWEKLEPHHFPRKFEAELTFVLRDGRSHHERIDDVFGNVSRPPSEQDIRMKFRANAGRSLPESGVHALENALEGLGSASSLAAFTAACRGAVQET
ncbi:MmgE/PrpD family protein [Bradyrhizobium sp. LHD-71]|uniref:MmgE/PrpD family protein n=1 Tax=Bradyrhizobium sp. LHD-71 TaxID=3072141 RepID=UPI00280EE859|nr:MmgE/PrpD family protein [Bradyrhizobium sp. LHD-71]MDQ8727348.1 MmgE/PrpD family protein [Bradyrhizobium sp. LHD-71]